MYTVKQQSILYFMNFDLLYGKIVLILFYGFGSVFFHFRFNEHTAIETIFGTAVLRVFELFIARIKRQIK